MQEEALASLSFSLWCMCVYMQMQWLDSPTRSKGGCIYIKQAMTMQLFQHANFIPNIPSTECATRLSYHQCTHMYSQLSWHRGWSGASESHRLKQQLTPFNLTRHALIIELANYNLVGTRCAVQHARDILLLLPYYYILPHLYDKAFLNTVYIF